MTYFIHGRRVIIISDFYVPSLISHCPGFNMDLGKKNLLASSSHTRVDPVTACQGADCFFFLH